MQQFIRERGKVLRPSSNNRNKLLYERKIGTKDLHPNARVMAMGNLIEDNAYVLETPTHTKSRQVHFYVRQDCREWVEWALKADIDMRVIAFANSAPTMLSKFDPDSVDINYPCARTLETLSNNVKTLPVIERTYLPLLQGIIGVGAGLQFYNFCQLSDKIPTIDDMLANPTGVIIPTESSYRHAMSGILAENLSEANGATLLQCILRLPMEYQHFVFSAACSRKPALLHKVEEIGEWADAVADKYLGKKY